MNSSEPIKIVDIGCGASCVYSLLGCKIFPINVKITALEPSYKNFEIASKNIKRNGIDRVEVLNHKFEEYSEDFDVCVCNPPFYDTNESDKNQNQNRTGRRKKGKFTVSTGHRIECSVEGGEVKYVKSLIAWSVRKNIKLGSTMLGKKSSVDDLIASEANQFIT